MDSKQYKEQQAPDIRAAVRRHYGKAAAGFKPKQPACCGGNQPQKPGLQNLYETPDALDLPAEVSGLSMGCGDPVTLASLQPGQTVLDLGSGGGIDCFLAAKQVGESGRVIGVDMTAEMIEKARANARKMGYPNVEFRLGEIENLPVGDSSVDVILSNCVINLSPDKPQVFREALRVLKPGGRLAFSDIVTDGLLPQPIRDSLEAWAGCIAGALDVNDFARLLEEAGFEQVVITPKVFDEQTIQPYASSPCCSDAQAIQPPASSSCCSDTPAIHSPASSSCCSGQAADETAVVDTLSSEAVEISPETLAKMIFSARISAVKPAA